MFDVVKTDVDRVWESEGIVDLFAGKVGEIEIEPLQVEDQVIWSGFEASSGTVSSNPSAICRQAYRFTASTNLPPHDSHLYLLSPSITSPCTKACRLSWRFALP